MIRKFQIIYRDITSSIAFLPAVISLLFLSLSLLVVYLEISLIGAPVIKKLEVLMVKGNDNARHVLSALISGIISLTVFSFSMVMVLLNQASSSFTPRILPGLLTDKKHQFILGFCIGTIIYCIIIILNIRPGEMNQNSPKLGVLLAMVFGVVCLALFIYFIHLISQKLQVDKIIDTVTRLSLEIIQKAPSEECHKTMPTPITCWHPLYSDTSGYLNYINRRELNQIGKKHQLQITLLYPLGAFLIKNTRFCQVSSLKGNGNVQADDKLHKKILACFGFSYEPFSEDSYLHGINQISEIAVKSLSPGINDPGTALIALDHLSAIFCCLYRHEQTAKASSPGFSPVIIYKQYSLQDLLFQFINPISNYGKTDSKVHLKLLEFYERLLSSVSLKEKEIIYEQLEELKISIEENVHSSSQAVLLINQIHTLRKI